MNKIINLLNIKWVLLITLFLASLNSHASHSMGADLTYKWMGGNTYKITLIFYRDCNGISAPIDPIIDVISTCGNSTSVTCYARAGTGKEITPICPSANTTCTGGSYTGV